MIFISLTYTNLFAQIETNEKIELKRALRFDEWKGKNHGVTNGINLSNEEIPALLSSIEIKPKCPFFISKQENGQFYVKYRSKWKHGDDGFVEITISFLNSGLEAHEYLIDQFISSTLPPDIKINSIDNPKVVGDISFYQGRIFIRDNIVVNIHAEGNFIVKVKEIAQEIDEVFLNHKTINSGDLKKPYIILDRNGEKHIVEP